MNTLDYIMIFFIVSILTFILLNYFYFRFKRGVEIASLDRQIDLLENFSENKEDIDLQTVMEKELQYHLATTENKSFCRHNHFMLHGMAEELG